MGTTDFGSALNLYLDLIKKISDTQLDYDDKVLARQKSTPKNVFYFKTGRKFITVFIKDSNFHYKFSLINKESGEIFKQVGKEKVLLGSIFNLEQYLLDLSGPPKHFCY